MAVLVRFIFGFTLLFCLNLQAHAQLKETAQLATLTPTAFVLTSGAKDDFKLHYAVSTSLYLASYMITESEWKAALITLFLGAAKELVYDELLGKGDPKLNAMGWNTLGVAQGAVFTFSLKL